jgi:hypothetical protein
MSDTITIGTIAGFAGTIVMTIYKGILLLFGFKFITTWETAAHIILAPDLCQSPIGYFIGFTMQCILGSIVGVIVAYTLPVKGTRSGGHYLVGFGRFFYAVFAD